MYINTPILTHHIAASHALLNMGGKTVETQLRLSRAMFLSTVPAAPVTAPAKTKAKAKPSAGKSKAAPKPAPVAKAKPIAKAPKAAEQMRRRKARKAPSLPPAMPDGA